MLDLVAALVLIETVQQRQRPRPLGRAHIGSVTNALSKRPFSRLLTVRVGKTAHVKLGRKTAHVKLGR